MLGMSAPKIDNREVAFHIGRHPVHKPRRPRQYLNETTAGHDAFPLLILFGLNAVDELDRTIFGVLAPNIRDAFHLSNGGFTALVAVTLLGGLLLEVPLAFYSDRLPRVRIAVLGAAVWAVFGLMTGLVTTLAWLVVARSGAGMGRAVVTPTHNSLLADYYPIEVRADVFGFHRMANAVGAFIGPALGGLIAYYTDWRVPFIIFFFPTIVFVILGMRLKEPGRGHFERDAGGRRASGRRHRRSAALVGGVGAHPLAGAHPPAHLVLVAVPCRVGDRPRDPDEPLLRGSVRAQRSRPRVRRRHLGARADHRHHPRHPARVAG